MLKNKIRFRKAQILDQPQRKMRSISQIRNRLITLKNKKKKKTIIFAKEELESYVK
ncbi:unnamed protein product [Paramecium sonneborni]|uniref:Uncharacterized protein n=1 Tax=Paramecium sonneborni TaxID=65129 RepID=A0A8S1N397_9CILI|nr:unnamed protein product [Paramecium sonneborni]